MSEESDLSTIGTSIKTFFEKKYFEKIKIESIGFEEKYHYQDNVKTFYISMSFRFHGKWDSTRHHSHKSYKLAFEILKLYIKMISDSHNIEKDVED